MLIQTLSTGAAATKSCKVAEGDVRPARWCKAFDLRIELTD